VRITRRSTTAPEPTGIGEYAAVIIIWTYIIYYIICRGENYSLKNSEVDQVITWGELGTVDCSDIRVENEAMFRRNE
jgi:hypothetical protein